MLATACPPGLTQHFASFFRLNFHDGCGFCNVSFVAEVNLKESKTTDSGLHLEFSGQAISEVKTSKNQMLFGLA